MLLLHTVLAVVCSGLLVSARPEPVRGRDWYAEDTEFIDADVPSYQVQQGAPAEFDDAWECAPQGPQHILGTPSHHPEGFPFPDPDREHWPESPHPFHEPPQRDPSPPQFPPQYPPEPHYPPPRGPPGAPPPPKERLPHFPHHPPHFPKPGDDTKEQTVYQFLEGHPKFSRLFKLVNYTEDVTSYLNDSSQSVTFFALPDFGFPKPPHHHDGDNDEDLELDDLFQMHEGSLGDMLAAAEGYLTRASKPDEGKVKAFIKYALLYNILPEKTPLYELEKNTTFATALKLPDGSLDGKPLRVRVKRNRIGLDPRPSVNFVSKVLVPDVPVKNGVVHVVNKPILPPPSIFQIGFLFSDAFSTFTSALQRVGLTDELDLRNTEDGSLKGSPAVSVFAPTNKAFARLPPKLKLFLFSPFGEKVLKKLLQFHIIPEAVLHSDYFHNASKSFALPRDTSEVGEFYAQLDHHPEDWSAIFEAPLALNGGRFDDEDAYESGEWRDANLNPDSPSSWENEQCQYGVPESFPHEAPRGAPQFPYPSDDHPQYDGPFPWPPPPHHPSSRGGPHRPPRHAPPPSPPPPPPPEVWLHYPPPRPPHHPHDGPHNPPHFPPPPPPPDVWVHYPAPPPPPHGPHHPPHFPAPPPPPFEHWPHHQPHHSPPPPPPPPPHGPHGRFPPAPPPPPGKLPKGGPPHHRRPEVVYSVNATVPTLLENHPLEVKIVQVVFKGPHPRHPSFVVYETFVVAHGQPVAVADIAARNGAIHVITKLLNPRKKPGHHRDHDHDEEVDEPTFRPLEEEEEEEEDEWAGWEEWLPRWAEEQD